VVTGGTASSVSTGKYKYTLTTAQLSTLGKFRAVWSYTIGGIANTKTDYYDVVVGYANAAQVKEMYPSLASKTNDEIYAKEKLARKIIDVFCNQNFGFEDNVAYTFRGGNDNNLYLGKRLYNLTSVKIGGTDDITSELEILDDYWLAPSWDARPGFFVQDTKRGLVDPSQRYFRGQLKYEVTGDWGWEYVPDSINLAACMLINDYFCDTTLLREHGVISYQLGEKSMTFQRDFWGTTGNFDVDQLLSEYTFVDVYHI
jgi:hypothetical protein